MKTVRIMSGLPGSGKSTLARSWAGALICSSDDFHMVDGVYRWKPENAGAAHSWNLRRFDQALRDRIYDMIVVDNTNCTVWEIAPYYALALAYDYDPTIYSVGCDIPTAILRNTHEVPAVTIERMAWNMAEHRKLFPPFWKVTDVPSEPVSKAG